MRHLPTPVRWAATALAVAACAGLSGCMSVSDDGSKPTPGASGGKRGVAAESEAGGGAGGDTGSWNGRPGQTGPDVAGAGGDSPVPSGSPSGTARASVGEVLPVEGPGGTPKPKPTGGGHENPGGGTGGTAGNGSGGSGGSGGNGSGGGSGGPGGATPTPEPTVPTAEPTPEPTVNPTPEPTPEPTSNPTDPPQSGTDTQMGALRMADGPGAPPEPVASPQVGPV
ncbi:hypothetical protein [Streptomyces sp. NPDC059247]|uniref:hypothetical protein n=1 Tax=Streptomyces sp. NPDC059247 TaxID=3346790 RepID=UPI003698B4DD